MTRSLPEWIGRTPDTPIPPSVKLRVFDRYNGRCWKCTRKLVTEPWECDHKKPLIQARKGENLNRESNLAPICGWCHVQKTNEEKAEKAGVARKRKKHLGLDKPKRSSFQTNRDKPWKAKVGGGVERR